MKLLISEALFCLFFFDLMRFGKSFPRLYRFVKARSTAAADPPSDLVDRVCKAVNWACVWYPKRVRCLQRSMTITWMLRRRGKPAAMVMGNQKAPFKAHAWTEVDGTPVNERRNVQAIYEVWERC